MLTEFFPRKTSKPELKEENEGTVYEVVSAAIIESEAVVEGDVDEEDLLDLRTGIAKESPGDVGYGMGMCDQLVEVKAVVDEF